MVETFTDIMFTPSVKAAQEQLGSRAMYEKVEKEGHSSNELTDREKEFIEARDSFYQATVGETGWPYVQFRGGPTGFLKVLNDKTIGYADFRGNVQYLSVGNLNADDRIALILMDYPKRKRLKIWARATLINEDENPELLQQLEIPTYRARIERAVILTIEAFDWNCPQHITPRFTEFEQEDLVAPLKTRISELEKLLDAKSKELSCMYEK
ncbi:MAG: pyridoxamine 5'-phosphate oxidase [Rhodospirillaceae bacterium]|jgi:predicted pyridoxine 5'-phosphate oxidase superfamily flavin-nucleotide-binding protein|nr:pyridoxamine 5'-phosphate oxidase [Rhodospirillaceae bacterium]MBT4590374.1 pyridoxamine 5'-phosphate oxidase [Rhodospirillaceae bacterium]